MKKIIPLLLILMLLVGILAGCGGNTQTGNVKTLDNGVRVNIKFDPNEMVTVTGEEYAARGGMETHADRPTGIGVTLTDTLVGCFEDRTLEAYADIPYALYYSFLTEKELQFRADLEVLSKAEILEKYPDFGNQIFDVFGVIRCEKDNPDSEEKLNFWKEFYAHTEIVCEYEGNTYYFGYNDDYSHLETTEKDRETLDKIISEVQFLKDGLCIYTPESEETELVANLNSFESTTLSGEKVTQDIFKDYDITMINIWATWCSPCVADLPEIGDLYQKLPENVNVISICTDARDESELANEILEASNCKFTTVVNNETLDVAVLDKITALPTTIFVDSNGNIVGDSQVGAPAAEGEIADAYLELINERLALIGK